LAHRVTSAHLQAAYPFVAEGGLPCTRVYVGRDLFGSSFVFDLGSSTSSASSPASTCSSSA
jgi:hypothetical protein